VGHVAVVLDLHQLGHLHGAEAADATEVVASEVHEHEVLGPLLLVGQEIARDRVVATPVVARPRPRDRPRLDFRPSDPDEHLRGRAGDREVAVLEEVHVGGRVHHPQPAVDRERVDPTVDGVLTGENDLEDVARRDVLLGGKDGLPERDAVVRGRAGGGSGRRVAEGRRSQPRSCSKPSRTCCARSKAARFPGSARAIRTRRCRTWSKATRERKKANEATTPRPVL